MIFATSNMHRKHSFGKVCWPRTGHCQDPRVQRVAHRRKTPPVPGRLPAGLQPGARQDVHLRGDLIDVVRSALATLNTLEIVSVC
ncbi:hypothetical protein MTO96_016735 [Rhipicephalus appendiculatus]